MDVRARVRATGLPRTAWVLAIAGFLVAVGFGVLIPVLGPFARTFDASSFELGIVVSVFALVRLITSPFATRIGRAFGERNTMAVGMFIVAASSVATALATSLEWMYVARGFGGIGSAMFTVSAMNLLLATTPEHLRGRAAGVYQGGFLLGNMAGPALGGLLGALSLTAPFYFYAGTLALAGLVTAAMLPAHAPAIATATVHPSRSLAEVAWDARYQAACAVGFGQGWQSFGVRNSLIPVFVTEALLRDTKWTGIAFAVAAVAQTLAIGPVGTATDRLGRRPVMIASGLICGVSAIAMPWSGSIWVLIAVLSVYGVGAAMQSTAPTAAVGDATGGRGGAPVAAFSMVTDVGSIVGPLVAGAIVDHASFHLAFAVSGAILLLGALAAMLVPPSLDREFQRSPA